ncbi:MAG: hypothetical protein L6R42_000462 [Xanthoria sp. 1 TBL-2021]|nr:MAG: hypothetical protein L6R42_000462 [Xanthoria sp. 1 TBL-2021]
MDCGLDTKLGADTFTAVSPTINIFYTCDAEVITQLLKGKSFTKPAELLQILNIFGPTMTGSDGEETRLYRRTTAPFFNKRTFQRVWTESVGSVDDLLTEKFGFGDSAITDLRPILARLTLHILNRIAFEKEETLREELKVPTKACIHDLGYFEAMSSVLDNFAAIFVTPCLILRYSPFQTHKNAFEAYSRLRRHLKDLKHRKEAEEEMKRPKHDPSLLEAVVGNMFIFMFAGHEASANTLHFIIILLACNPEIQASMQKDIDDILGAKSKERWSYDEHFQRLMESLVGAVIHEALRLFTVIPFILKATSEASQSLVLNDRTHVIPPNTLILISTSGAHHNPKHWPGPRKAMAATKPNPLDCFNPRYWLGHGDDKGSGFLRPVSGSFIPFSDGSRGCLGQHFSMVELCAIITAIFTRYRVELIAPDIKATASEDTKREAWQESRDRAKSAFADGVTFEMSLRMVAQVPIKFVSRA